MDNSVGTEIRVATLEAKIRALQEENATLRAKNTALESVSRIEAQQMKKLQRQLAEAQYGAAARKDGPSSARAIDKG